MKGILFDEGEGPQIKLHELGGIASGSYSYPLHPSSQKFIKLLGIHKKFLKKGLSVNFRVMGAIEGNQAKVYSILESLDEKKIIEK